MSLTAALLAELTDADLDALATRLAPRLADRLVSDRQPERWLTVEQAAEHLALSTSQIYQLCHKRHSTGFPVHKDGSRSYFKASELDRWRLQTESER